MDPPATARFLQDLGKVGDAAKAHRLAVAEFVAKKHLASPDAVRCSTGDWRGLAEGVAKDLDAASKQTWADKVHEAFADPKTLKGLGLNQVWRCARPSCLWVPKSRISSVLRGCRPGAGAPAAPASLQSLAKNLGPTGDEGKTLRRRVAEEVARKHLGSADAVRGPTCREWRDLADSLGKDLDEPARREWCEKLRGAFTEPKTLGRSRRGMSWTSATRLGSLGRRTPTPLP